VCPPGAVPDLCDAQGELHGPITAAIRCLLDPGLPEQLEREIRAQFDAFSATGLRLDHVNAHNNMQLHPIVLPILLRVAREYGARAMRLPFEPLLSSWRAARRGLARRIAIWSVMRPWAAYVKRRIAGAGFAVNDHLFGIYDCGQLDTGLFTRLVRHLPEGVSEIHCHPATRRCPEIDRSMPRYRHEQELSALHSPALRDALHAPGLRVLAGFGELPS
jgi:hopanoid biosynthesis associated protein HpnK